MGWLKTFPFSRVARVEDRLKRGFDEPLKVLSKYVKTTKYTAQARAGSGSC